MLAAILFRASFNSPPRRRLNLIEESGLNQGFNP